MSFSFSNSSIENLKDQVNIVDVVGRVVPLKRAGNNYKGVCPFHNEKTPSFVVSDQKQIFTCFGCGASGDLIEFVKRYYNLEFGEAVEKIASEHGIVLEKSSYDDNRSKYFEVNKLAAEFFYKGFTEKANKGYSYMKNRGISPQILKKFGIGYADENWDSLYNYLISKNIDKKIMVELGLVSVSNGKYYDKFRNRVIFPIINTNGKVIGFGGRAIGDDNPKYLNSPESVIFQKKNNLYGLNLSRQSVGKENFIILVEGYMDTIALYQAGVQNVAASLGTALTENQAKLIKRYTKDGNVVLSYDADSAGRKAALRGLDILRNENCKVKVLHVTDGKDPDEFIKKNGKNAFLKLVYDALPYGDYKLEAAKEGFNLSRDDDKIDYMKKAVGIIKGLSPVEQDIYINKLAKELNIASGAIRMELLGTKQEAVKKNHHEENEKNHSSEVSTLERTLIKLILTDEEHARALERYPEIFESDVGRRVFNLVIDTLNNNNFMDAKKIMDALTPEDGTILEEILDQVVVAGKEDAIFTDCLHTWRRERLMHQEKELLKLLTLADEENNEDRIIELQAKLMSVQRERKNLY